MQHKTKSNIYRDASSLEPHAGELQALRHNLHRLCAPNPGPMTGPGTNTYLYGETELAVFDAGPLMSEHIDNILACQEMLNAPITALIASHTHSDHSPAIAKLAEQLPNAQIIGAPAEANQEYEDHTFKPDFVPRDDDLLNLPHGRIRAIHTPGHVANHFCYLIEEHNLLTTGDHLMNGSTVVLIPPKGNMQHYIQSLQKLENYKIDSMAPGHGALINNPKELVAWTIKHRLDRESKVLRKLDGSASSLSELVKLVYDDVDSGLHRIAELSLHAHLIKLEAEGKARETSQGWSLG